MAACHAAMFYYETGYIFAKMPVQTLSHAADGHLHKATHSHPWCVQEVHTQKQLRWRISLLLKRSIDSFFDYSI